MAKSVTEQIEKFQEFVDSSYKKELHKLIREGKTAITLDFSELSKFDHDLAESVLDEPEELIKAAELAIEQLDFQKSFRVRFKNLPESQKIQIRDLRATHINKFVHIQGIVRQASDIRPQVISTRFECPACGNVINLLQNDQKFKEPTRCSCGRKGKFRLLSKDLVDTQRLIIEEASEDLEGGAQPKRLSIFLREDLVEPKMEKRTTPGAKVLVNGVLKEIPVLLKTGVTSTRYDLIIEANYIEPIQEEFLEIDVSQEEEEEIKALAKDPRIYEKMINSIAPSIYGHELIKEALILQLMGGVRKVKEDGTITRGDMHILLVGDPGSGKSALLSFISKVAPKARYIAGRSASGAGITASVVKDEFLRGWALEAGAMVLAHRGVLCLDEMDKMTPEDTSALHEGLEQQQITISKANIQATLRSQTTVLAAANPKYGRFDPYTPIAKQIELPPALINRFDLIFPVKDLPDRVKDAKIAHHVLQTQQAPGNIEPDIPYKLLRKYIGYAKKNVFPKLTKQAIQDIEEFYVNLRNTETTTSDSMVKPIPISARQLEALVRLAEGSARITLSDKITRKDTQRAIGLLKHCLNQVGIDPDTGQFDIDRISTGITSATRNKILIIRDIINNLEATGSKTIPIDDIIIEAENKGINETAAMEILEKLKREGEVFEPKANFLQKI